MWGSVVSFFEKRGHPYDRATEDVYVIELAEDFCEDFDWKIE